MVFQFDTIFFRLSKEYISHTQTDSVVYMQVQKKTNTFSCHWGGLKCKTNCAKYNLLDYHVNFYEWVLFRIYTVLPIN